ncbi:solute carrier family 15 member 1-like [Rhincodon typus]|uniref:solute carrier family 15 member 1-like n=1 Tax=Rhincodon typus TaxID=259920 RepID=UPI002030531E|nr:solute carrier family 15 member 1-like [Rhincodon typus]
MTIGMFLAAFAFVAAALVQIQIDKTLPIFPAADQSQIKVINVGHLSVNVTLNGVSNSYSLNPSEATDYAIVPTSNIKGVCVSYGGRNETFHPEIRNGTRLTLLITNFPNPDVILLDDYEQKPEEGKNAIRFATALSYVSNITMDGTDFGDLNGLSATNYSLFTKGTKRISYIIDGIKCKQTSKEFGFGSAFTIIINETCHRDNFKLNYIEEIKPNTVHMAWQIPQYLLITSGEVVFSVTGLAFSYSQAPSNMKSVLQAGWLLTNAIGNIVVLIVAEASTIQEQWAEYILFAALLIAVCMIFAFMAYFYTYVDPAQVEEEITKKKAEDLGKTSNY